MTISNKIIVLKNNSHALSSIVQKKNPIVLVGGCFDILHIGHIRFLQEARSENFTLVILLESDIKVKQLKGPNRPYFSQTERAEMLAALSSVDFVLLLPEIIHDSDYEKLILILKPSIIAMTQHDKNMEKKQQYAKKVGADIKIIPLVKTSSSSKVAKLLGIE